MSRFNNDFDMSKLEQEFELEMNDLSNVGEDNELESLLDGDSEFEYDETPNYEYEEDEPSSEWEYPVDNVGTYAERLFELSQREFENEYELEFEVDKVLNDMEREYFWGALKRLAKRVVKNPLVRGLAKKAYGFVSSKLPFGNAIKGITQLMRGNLKGALGSAAKALINTYVPGGATALSGIADAVGINPESSDKNKQETIEKFVEGAEKAYEFAAENLHPNVDNPLEANRLASQAFEVAVRTMQGRPPARPAPPPPPRAPRRSVVHSNDTKVVRLIERPGENIKKVMIIIEKAR
jgi:hypothetical protein